MTTNQLTGIEFENIENIDAVTVSRIVNKYINHNECAKKKDDKIDELLKKIDILLYKNKKMSKKLDIIREQNEDIINIID